MSDWTIFDDTFWLTLAGLLFGIIGLGIRMCYRSKCRTVDCLGLHIVRDVDVEGDIDLQTSNEEDEVKT
jgi:hypothetical protein